MPTPVRFTPAHQLAPGDHIDVGFGGYGRVVMRVDGVFLRGDLVDLHVHTNDLDHTTVRRADAEVGLYPAAAEGKWLS